MPYEEPPRAHGTLHSGVGYAAPKIVPHDADLDRAADVLNAGKKVAMLVGAGALGATDEVIAVADRLAPACAKALLGKAALPDELPWVTGSIGLLGTEPSYKMMTECDTLLMVGSGFPYSEFLPKEGQARGVQIDIDAEHAVASAIRWRSVSSAMPPRRCARCCRCLQQKPIGELARDASKATSADWWKTLEERAQAAGQAGQSAARRPGSCRRACRSARSSPAIPAPAPTGMRAT